MYIQKLHDSNHPNHFLLPKAEDTPTAISSGQTRPVIPKHVTTGTGAARSVPAHLPPFRIAQCVNTKN